MQIAYLGPDPWLPELGSVSAALEMLDAIRNPHASSSRLLDSLERMQIAHLGARRPSELGRHERRAVLLAYLLGLDSLKVVLLCDPFTIAGVNQLALVERLHELASTAVVLLATDQAEDVQRLGAAAGVFSAGRLLEPKGAHALRPSEYGCFRVTCDQPQRLTLALQNNPAVHSVQAPLHTSTLEVTGTNPEQLSLAILGAINELGIQLYNLTDVPVQLEVLQAAVRGRVDGMYAAAYHAGWVAQQAQPWHAGSSPSGPGPTGYAPIGRAPDAQMAYSGQLDAGGRALPTAATLQQPTTDVSSAPSAQTPAQLGTGAGGEGQ
jgi:energy-coupling factor transporter ATP-binding protein EcfA2